MTDKVKNALLVAASFAALALGGSAIAAAASGNGSNSSGSSGRTHSQGLPAQRSDENLLTGDTEAKVRAAALAKVPGGSIERVETDADGHAAYEAHMLSASGNRVTVYVNSAFEVVSVESGP
jgi:uncharacterized membrane protein YkoI